MSNVKATSAAVTGTPSCHFARGSRWNVSVTLSVQSHRAASCGTKPSSPMVLADIPTSASLRNSWSDTSRAIASWVIAGRRMSGSPGAAMTSVPQKSPLHPPRAVHPMSEPTSRAAATEEKLLRDGFMEGQRCVLFRDLYSRAHLHRPSGRLHPPPFIRVLTHVASAAQE